MNRLLHRITLTISAAGLSAIIAACGSASSGGTDHQGMPGMPGMNGTPTSTAASTTATGMPTAGQDHNAADVTFAAGMVPHHQQAVTMARTALQKSTNPQVTALARDIDAAQGPEIATMSGWLSAWGQPVPTAGGHDMSQMSGGTAGGMGMGGMMSDQEMQQLDSATGTAFDRMWVQLMIRHHQGAVAMSTAELATGQNAAAKQLAQQIISAQDKEITVMQQLLPTLPG